MGEKKGQGKVVRAGIGYTIGNYMLKGLSFLTVPIFSRLLSTADYGMVNKYLAYQTIVFLLIGMALHTSLKNAKYKYGEKFHEYNSCCILLVTANLGVWLLLCNLVYPLYGGWVGFSRVVINLLLIDSFGTALIQFFNVYVGLDYRYTSFLKLSAFHAVANLGMTIGLILTVFHEDRATGRIFGNAIPVGLIAVIIIWYFWRNARPRFDCGYVGYAIRYSLPLIPHGVSQVILSQFDRLMIEGMIGLSQAGIYSFAYNIFSIINVTATSLENVWGPWFYEKMEEGDEKSIRSYSSKYAFGMLLFSVMVMLGTPELVKILGVRAFWDSMYAVIPIVVGGYFMFLSMFPSYVEYYYEKTKLIAVGTGVAAVVNIVLNRIFLIRFGYLAAAYTTLATYLLYFIFHYIIAWRIQKHFIFDTGKLMLYILGALGAGGVSLLLIQSWIIRWIFLLLTGLAGGIWLAREMNMTEWIKRKLQNRIEDVDTQ